MMILDNLIVGHDKWRGVGAVSGYIKKGSMVAIIGPNGIGKSTLLKTLAGLLLPISGTLEFKKPGRPNISYLPQIKKLDYFFPITVFDVVSMGCWPKVSLFIKLGYHQQILIRNALKKVKLLDLRYQYIEDLSGGQFQRMLFARILVQQLPLILLDEPFQGVDMNICHIMMQSINQLCSNGCTVIMVLHDKKMVDKYFSNTLILTNTCSAWRLF